MYALFKGHCTTHSLETVSPNVTCVAGQVGTHKLVDGSPKYVAGQLN